MSMIPIASSTVGAGGATSIVFSNIPQTFTHLQLRIFARSANLSGGPNMPTQFNGDTGNNYNGHYVAGSGSSAFSNNFPGAGSSLNFGWCAGTNTTANVFGVSIVDILDYTNTNKNKVIRAIDGVDDNAGGTGNNLVGLWSGVWLSTAAITSISISGHTYAQNTRVDLYGITNSPATGA